MTGKTKPEKPEDIETEPDAWDRFEHAIDAAVKSGPKHRTPPKPRKTKPKSEKREPDN